LISISALLVGRQSGIIVRYSLPHISFERKIRVNGIPEQLSLNSDSTRVSIIDREGMMTVNDIENDGKVYGEEKKEIWSVVWSKDNPEMMAYMEKNRLHIIRGNDKEDPVGNVFYPCEFSNLEVKGILLDEIMQSPEAIKDIEQYIVSFETKGLRDVKKMLEDLPIKEVTEFIEKNSHIRLWQLLAEKALEKDEFETAERAFIKCQDLYGIKFIKRVKMLDDPNKRKAEIAIYYKRYEKAEEIYNQIGRNDLSLDLWKRIGNYKKVIPLLGQGTASDVEVKEANKKMGDYYAEKGKWSKAASYYAVAQAYPILIDAYYKAEDYESLRSLIEEVPADPELIEALATKFNSVGMCECAVEAYLRINEVKKAIDSCILLNNWNQVLININLGCRISGEA